MKRKKLLTNIVFKKSSHPKEIQQVKPQNEKPHQNIEENQKSFCFCKILGAESNSGSGLASHSHESWQSLERENGIYDVYGWGGNGGYVQAEHYVGERMGLDFGGASEDATCPMVAGGQFGFALYAAGLRDACKGWVYRRIQGGLGKVFYRMYLDLNEVVLKMMTTLYRPLNKVKMLWNHAQREQTNSRPRLVLEQKQCGFHPVIHVLLNQLQFRILRFLHQKSRHLESAAYKYLKQNIQQQLSWINYLKQKKKELDQYLSDLVKNKEIYVF